MKLTLIKTLLALSVVSVSSHLQAQHLNAGAVGTAQNDQLYFINGASYVAGSGYMQTLTYTNSGRFAGYFQSSGPTFTAAPQTTNNNSGGPALNAPAFGSFERLQVVSVAGPDGGNFGYWANGATSPTYSAAVGLTGGTYQFDLSDASLGAGELGADPFGHLHGRRFTATAPGLYTVGFQIYDTSVNGLGGGPIHAPSDVFYLNYNAVPEPSSLALAGLSLGSAAVWYRRRQRHNL